MRSGAILGVTLVLAGCSAPAVEAIGVGGRSGRGEPVTVTVTVTVTDTVTATATATGTATATATAKATATITTFNSRYATAALGTLERGTLKGPRGRRAMNCTGLVQACFDALECDERPTGSARDLHTWCVANDRVVETPAPGDLVFFDDTWDRDGDGRPGDPLTHVGVVVETEPDGRVRFIHVGSRKIKDGVLHLGRPDVLRDAGGDLLNSPLRVRRKRDPRGTRYLAGQLLCGFCRPQPCGPGGSAPSEP
ncbi:MAG: CHAP domain-containing protein [Pseudomonadota bacterium]